MTALAQIKRQFIDVLSSFRDKICALVSYVKHQLSISQQLYLLAMVYWLFIMSSEASVFEGLSLTGFIALIALFTEVWPKFVRIWETLLGRICLILFYAIVANFAVAFASYKVNQVVGIDPSPLFFTLSFTTLLLAPLWVFAFTVISMLIYMVFLQLWLIGVFFLKLIRVPIYRDKSKFTTAHPILTNVIRITLLPVMLSFIGGLTQVYTGDAEYNLLQSSKSFNPLAQSSKLAEDTNTTQVATAPENSPNNTELGQVEASDNVNSRRIEQAIAWFVYSVETYQYSQCQKADDEKAVFVGETDILLSKKDPSAPLGYAFSVRVCELLN